MATGIADTLLHFDADLDERRYHALEEFVRHEPGVVSVGSPNNDLHLMMVLYNPLHIQPRTLLGQLSQHGLHVTQIGL